MKMAVLLSGSWPGFFSAKRDRGVCSVKYDQAAAAFPFSQRCVNIQELSQGGKKKAPVVRKENAQFVL